MKKFLCIIAFMLAAEKVCASSLVSGVTEKVAVPIVKHIGMPVGVSYATGVALLNTFEAQAGMPLTWGYKAYGLGQILVSKELLCGVVIFFAARFAINKILSWKNGGNHRGSINSTNTGPTTLEGLITQAILGNPKAEPKEIAQRVNAVHSEYSEADVKGFLSKNRLSGQKGADQRRAAWAGERSRTPQGRH